MKNLFFIALLGLFFGACQQQPITPTPTPAANICDYAPFSTGSVFKYVVPSGDTITDRVLGDTVVNGYYCKLLSQTANNQTTKAVYYCGNGFYMHRNFYVPGYNVVVDSLIYLKDNVTANTSWMNSFSGSFNGFSVLVEYEETYVGLAATRVVNGVTFNDVIERQQKVYMTLLGTRTLTGTYSYWYGKNVGLIETTLNGARIVSYNIVP